MATRKQQPASTLEATPAAEPQLLEVTLEKPHTHGEVKYDTGATIKVTAPERDWLVAQEIIAAPAAAKETK